VGIYLKKKLRLDVPIRKIPHRTGKVQGFKRRNGGSSENPFRDKVVPRLSADCRER
jgi:hypothetical protein